jgi:DNA helicase HerA-like ATPase
MYSPIERLSQLTVGVVESVSPDEIRVLLQIDAPHSTALNTGVPTSFPRLNGYVLIPNEAGATVAYIAWIGIERSAYPKTGGLKDIGLVDLPFPLRKMCLCPVGTLTSKRDRITATTKYQMSRGVAAFPSVGDQVLMPTSEQVEAIVGATDADRRVRIGSSPMAANAAIKVDPDKLFGRHLAVLGNTGSGKSCTVAGLIRWSLDASENAIREAGKEGVPNARFIVLDPNGEYAKAFQGDARRVRVFRPGDAQHPLVLPAWMWNSHEWSAVTNAQPGAQRPLLLQALRNLRAGRETRETIDTTTVRQLRLYLTKIRLYLADGTGSSYSGFPGNKNAGQSVECLCTVMQDLQPRLGNAAQQTALQSIITAGTALLARKRTVRNGNTYFDDFNIVDFQPFMQLFEAALAAFPLALADDTSSEDAPIPFDISMLADTIDDISSDGTANANVANFVSYLTLRIRSLMADQRLGAVINPEAPPTFEGWLSDYIGQDAASNGQLAILDLSLVPSDVTHIVIAVLGRLVFESLQRYRKQHPEGKTLPTVLVLEEAHTFVRRGRESDGDQVTPSRLCRETFERIAREGRKFGLGMVLSSQRPAELSPTVLAQCNTFLLHRIVNDADQDLVARLVPDNVAGLLRDLPSLPSRQAILLGWATPIPVLVEIDELPAEQRPQSDDPDFWDVWTLAKKRGVDWPDIAREWSGTV